MLAIGFLVQIIAAVMGGFIGPGLGFVHSRESSPILIEARKPNPRERSRWPLSAFASSEQSIHKARDTPFNAQQRDFPRPNAAKVRNELTQILKQVILSSGPFGA
jgi:hypothetical protein